jgi:hypothetical protein
MKKLLLYSAILLFGVVPSQRAHAYQGTMHGQLVIGQDFTLASGHTMDGDLVVVGGSASIHADSTVTGDVVIIGGSLSLDGQVLGSAIIIGGPAAIGQQASVERDVIAIGGAVQRQTGATIGGDIITNLLVPHMTLPLAGNIPGMPPTPRIPFEFGMLGRFTALFFLSLGLAALAMLLTAFLHPQIDRVAQAAFAQPFLAGSIGLLSVIATSVAGLILAITFILAPVALAAVLLLALAWLFGVVALGMVVGDRVTQATNSQWEPVLSAGLGTFILGIVVGTVDLIPCIGWLAPFLLGLLGLGAAVMTMFGTRPPAAVAAADAATGGRPPGKTA